MENDDKKFEFYPEGTLIPMPEPISLRDYFAAAALTSIPGSWIPDNKTKEELAASLAQALYMIADAMLKEREKT